MHDIILLHFPFFISRLFVFALLLVMMKRESEERERDKERLFSPSLSLLYVVSNCTLRSNSQKKGRADLFVDRW